MFAPDQNLGLSLPSFGEIVEYAAGQFGFSKDPPAPSPGTYYSPSAYNPPPLSPPPPSFVAAPVPAPAAAGVSVNMAVLTGAAVLGLLLLAR